jgi:hypothetical protein
MGINVSKDMKANELRIGNWLINELCYDRNNGLCRVTGIFHDLHKFQGYAIQTEEGNTTLLNDEDESYFKPIPLTEEWLFRFGLKEKQNHKVFSIGDMQFDCETMIGGFHDNETGLDYQTKIHIKYVNQLQNLYFALTGEELELI